MKLADSDRVALVSAFERLERPSLLIRISSAFGMSLETMTKEIGRRAPDAVVVAVRESTTRALELALRGSLRTLTSADPQPASPGLHTAAAATTGAVSGFFGAQGLLVELPLTTAIMFRSMADIARAEGESPDDAETIINVMQVFALGSSGSPADDGAETSYYGVRIAFGKLVSEALQYVVKKGVGNVGAPALVRLVTALAGRFGVAVTQKAMAQALPVVGAVGGGLVNTVFISHFQDMARGHFVIRRLERRYSPELIQEAYEALRMEDS